MLRRRPHTSDADRASAGRPFVSSPGATRVATTRLWALLVAVVTALGAIVVGTGLPGTATAATIVHVSPAGDDRAAGSASSPVRTIGQAVRIAPDGATVEIDAGTYHESVQVYAKELHLVAVGGPVVLDGARPVTDVTRRDDEWVAPWSTDLERAGAPFTTPDRPEAGWPDQFFLDGAPLREVTSRDGVVAGTFFVDRRLAEVVLGDDPSGRLLEGSDLTWGLYLNRADGSSVDGLTVRRYATQTREMAAVRAYANDLTVTDLVVEDNARIGISAMGDTIRLQGVTARRNGHLGIHGHRASDLVVTGSTVVRNNAERFDAKHSAGGMKVTDSSGLLVERSIVSDNLGPGVWTDLDVVGAVVRSSRMERNSRSGIEIELSSDVVVVDNVVVGNGEAGVWVLESSSVDVWHNTALHNVRDVWVEDGDRADLVGVRVANNVLGGGAPGATAVLNVDDWTERRSAADMAVEVDSNRYWIHPDSPTRHVSRWANWPSPLAMSTTIDQHRDATGGAVGSDVRVARINPFARSTDDVRQPSDAPVADPMPAEVAEAALVTQARAAGAITDMGRDTSTVDPGPSADDDPSTTGTGGTSSGTSTGSSSSGTTTTGTSGTGTTSGPGTTTGPGTTVGTGGGTATGSSTLVTSTERATRTLDLRGATLVVETEVDAQSAAAAPRTGLADTAAPSAPAAPDGRTGPSDLPTRRPVAPPTPAAEAETSSAGPVVERRAAPGGWSALHGAVTDALAGS